jgi:hypothetical protein
MFLKTYPGLAGLDLRHVAPVDAGLSRTGAGVREPALATLLSENEF